MKTKIKRHSRSALSILLTVCMLISCMTVGLIATDAARANSGTVASNGTAVNRTVYVKQSAVSSTTYSDYRVWFAHTDNNLINELITMTDTGKTIGDDKVYSATIYDIYDGLNKIYFQAFDDDSWAAQTKAVDKWTKYSIYNGKVWNGSSWEVPNWDTVYGVTGCTELTGDDWGVTNSENDMTKSGSSYTKTYNDIPAGSYEFKITKDHDSVALITINTQAVFYGNNNIVPVEAFYNCSSLEKIELSANLKSIQSNAFAGCTSLKYLVLFDTVTYIAPNAFDGDTNLTLGVYYDSYAYHYARDNSVPYKLLDGVKLGDVDKDGEITINDATFIQRYLAELENLKGIYLYAADANKDGEVDISDATTIQLSVAECPVPYPVGEVITE